MKYEFRYIVTVVKLGRKSFNNNNSFNNFGSPWIMRNVIFTFFLYYSFVVICSLHILIQPFFAISQLEALLTVHSSLH